MKLSKDTEKIQKKKSWNKWNRLIILCLNNLNRVRSKWLKSLFKNICWTMKSTVMKRLGNSFNNMIFLLWSKRLHKDLLKHLTKRSGNFLSKWEEPKFSNILKKSNLFIKIVGKKEYGKRKSAMIVEKKWLMEDSELRENLSLVSKHANN